MRNTLKQRFPPFLDEPSLRSAIASVCAEYGEVASLRILPATRGSGLHCACFLRLESSKSRDALRSKLHAVDFGDDLHFIADVAEDWTGATM